MDLEKLKATALEWQRRGRDLTIDPAVVLQLIEGQAIVQATKQQLVESFNEVLRISDRKHEAWDKAKAALLALQEDGHDCE